MAKVWHGHNIIGWRDRHRVYIYTNYIHAVAPADWKGPLGYRGFDHLLRVYITCPLTRWILYGHARVPLRQQICASFYFLEKKKIPKNYMSLYAIYVILCTLKFMRFPDCNTIFFYYYFFAVTTETSHSLSNWAWDKWSRDGIWDWPKCASVRRGGWPYQPV